MLQKCVLKNYLRNNEQEHELQATRPEPYTLFSKNSSHQHCRCHHPRQRYGTVTGLSDSVRTCLGKVSLDGGRNGVGSTSGGGANALGINENALIIRISGK